MISALAPHPKSRPKSRPNSSPMSRSVPSTNRFKAPLPNPFGASTDIPKSGKFIIIYGEAGFGKTSLAAQFPAPMFVITNGEYGIHHLKEQGIASADIPVVELDPLFSPSEMFRHQFHPGWEKAINTARLFATEKHDRQTLVYDTTSGLESLCYQHCACKHYGGDMECDEFSGFYKGYAKAGEKYWKPEFLDSCLRCAASGYDVILLAHANTNSRDANLSGPDFDRYVPDLQKAVWKYTKKDAQAVLFMGERIVVEKKQGKAKPTSKIRFIGVSNETWYFAKNWHNITTPIDQGSSPKETYEKLKEKMFN